jgi:predicted nucleotidyltransferase
MKLHNKKELKDNLCSILQNTEFVVFALLFGSSARAELNPMSDLDIGVYTERETSLIELGRVCFRLEIETGRSVDLVVLNTLYKKHPALAYRIITEGELLLCRDMEKFVEFKKNTFLYYLDTLYLIEKFNSALQERIKNRMFGIREYAGKVKTS